MHKNNTHLILFGLPISLLLGCQQAASPTKSLMPLQHAESDVPAVYIVYPQDGMTTASRVHVVFGLAGMGIAPAGVDHPNTGHHHLLIDNPDLPEPGTPLPSTDQIIHFGGGQTETWIDLEPGTHTLQLLLADFAHRPHDPPIKSDSIVITVSEP